jgi:ferredoxin
MGVPAVLPASGLQSLFDALHADGFVVVGPRRRDGAISFEPLGSAADLPRGIEDDQEPARYRLRDRGDDRLFAHAVGPSSPKRFLHPPDVTILRVRRDGARLAFESVGGESPRFAFLGLRPCDLAAIAVQDRVLLDGPYADPVYRARREGAFLAVANCLRPGGTCFCASMGTGPRATRGFDLALTELYGDDGHVLLIEAGSVAGESVLSRLPVRPAEEDHLRRAHEGLEAAAATMGRTLATDGLAERLRDGYEDPRWAAAGSRCLACASCTQVCPTCFCTSTADAVDLTGQQAERRRTWDSCFGLDFSYVHGGSVRTSAGARYRQWVTHKLATWPEQFGTSGCVGCGRCITWCPAGIDITVEASAIGAAGGAAR